MKDNIEHVGSSVVLRVIFELQLEPYHIRITAVPLDVYILIPTAECKRKSDEPQQIYYNALNTRIPNIPLIR